MVCCCVKMWRKDERVLITAEVRFEPEGYSGDRQYAASCLVSIGSLPRCSAYQESYGLIGVVPVGWFVYEVGSDVAYRGWKRNKMGSFTIMVIFHPIHVDRHTMMNKHMVDDLFRLTDVRSEM